MLFDAVDVPVFIFALLLTNSNADSCGQQKQGFVWLFKLKAIVQKYNFCTFCTSSDAPIVTCKSIDLTPHDTARGPDAPSMWLEACPQ